MDLRNILLIRSCQPQSSSTSTFSGLDVRRCILMLNLSRFSKSNRIAFCNLLIFSAQLANLFFERKEKSISSCRKYQISLFHKDVHWFFLRCQLCGQPSNICASPLRVQTGYNSASWKSSEKIFLTPGVHWVLARTHLLLLLLPPKVIHLWWCRIVFQSYLRGGTSTEPESQGMRVIGPTSPTTSSKIKRPSVAVNKYPFLPCLFCTAPVPLETNWGD